ncbi:MAG: hypothetical protein OXT67_12075 [Zetaproteobacteria bacterium]|nr:hypothetical protein [Zetaproteobacteria bacterium]
MSFLNDFFWMSIALGTAIWCARHHILMALTTSGHLLRMQLGSCRPRSTTLSLLWVALLHTSIAGSSYFLDRTDRPWLWLLGIFYGCGLPPFHLSSLKYWVTFSTQSTFEHLICLARLSVTAHALVMTSAGLVHVLPYSLSILLLSLFLFLMAALTLTETRPYGLLGLQYWAIISCGSFFYQDQIRIIFLPSTAVLTGLWGLHIWYVQRTFPRLVYIPTSTLLHSSSKVYRYMLQSQPYIMLLWVFVYLTAQHIKLGGFFTILFLVTIAMTLSTKVRQQAIAD